MNRIRLLTLILSHFIFVLSNGQSKTASHGCIPNTDYGDLSEYLSGPFPVDLLPEGYAPELNSQSSPGNVRFRFPDMPEHMDSSTEDPVVVRIATTAYGQVMKLLEENDAATATEIILSGPMDGSDFKAIWECAVKGRLRVLDLGGTRIKDKAIPDRALYDYSQFHEDNWLGIRKIILPDDVVSIGKVAFAMMRLEEINIPSSLRELGSTAFAFDHLLDCPLVFPEGFEKIHSHAFTYCTSLSHPIRFPSTLKMIGPYAFKGTPYLNEVKFNDGLEYIGEGAFQNCGLKEVRLPDSVVYLDQIIFQMCERLESVSLPATMERIPSGMFSLCYGLERIEIPVGVKVIEESAFMWSSGLKHVTLPESLEVIEKYAFWECDMDTVVLPSGLKSLGASCLAIQGLHTVFCMAGTPPVCDTDSDSSLPPFDATWISEATLYVPEGCAESYRSQWGWNLFKEIRETADFPSVRTPMLESDEKGTDIIFDLNGRKVSNPSPNHIYIRNGKKFSGKYLYISNI